MAPEKEPQAESDEQFRARLDDHIARFTIPLQRAKIARIVSGDAREYEEALAVYDEAMVQDDTTLARLDRLKEDPDSQKAHLARMIKGYVCSSEQGDLGTTINQVRRDWREIRASLSSPDGTIRGASLLLGALLSEQDPDRKNMLFTTLHAKDEDLASLMIALRNARNAYARQEGHTNYFSFMLAEMGVSEKNIVLKAEGWFRQMNALPRTPDEKIQALHVEDMYDTQDVSRRVAHRFGLGDSYERISFHLLGNESETASCVPIDPPGEVAVIVPENSTNLWLKNTFFNEIGHALHFASMAEHLPYVFRVSMGEMPWEEAMDALFTHLAMAYMVEAPAEAPGDESKKRLAWVTYADSIRSLQGSLLRFFFDAYFYATDEQDPGRISKEWSQIKRRLYGKDHPLYRGADAPEGYEGPLYEWDNDYWITEHPVDLDHLFGEMIAAQLREYWKKAGGTLLSPEFGEWLRKTCWEPGFSIPWRELLKDATGEYLNPKYFFNELEDMKKRFAES